MICLLAVAPVFGQGNDCSDAVDITALPYATPLGQYTTLNKGADIDSEDLCNNEYAEGTDFVFRFRSGSFSGCVDIKLSANEYPLRFGLFVTEDCPEFNGGTCIAQGVNTLQKSQETKYIDLYQVSLKPNTDYYIVVDNQYPESYYCFQFELTINPVACDSIKTGSGCDYARDISSLPFTAAPFTTCGNLDLVNQGSVCNSTFDENINSGKDYFFKYTPTADECIRIESNTPALSGTLASYIGCPYLSGATCMQKAIAAKGKVQDVLYLSGGETYYFVLSSDVDLEPCDTFDIEVVSIPIIGADCNSPIVVNSLPFKQENLLTTCKGNDFGSLSGCFSSSNNGDDLLFTYRSPGNECITVNMNDKVDSSYMSLLIADNCPSSPSALCLATSDNSGSFSNAVGVDYAVSSPRDLYIVADRAYSFFQPYLLFDIEISRNGLDPIGKDCTTPLDAVLPFSSNGNSTACKGVDYIDTNPCINNSNRPYMQGNDFLVRFTPTQNTCIRISATNIEGQGSFSLYNGCPNSGGCLGSMLCNASTDSVSIEYTVQAGVTYYLMAVSYLNTANLGFDLKINYLNATDTCLKCNDNICSTCANSGFEEMSGSNWTATMGDYDNPNESSTAIDLTPNNTSPKIAINSAGSYDRFVGPDLKTVSPFGGEYSVRLGDPDVSGTNPGYAESLTYSYKVDSSTANFYYYYAVVFQDPEHDISDQPYFRVQMFDQNNVSIPCGFYEASAAGDIPGFRSTERDYTIKWKNWTLVGVPLEAYIGQTIRVEFIVKDCQLGGHFGYAYIDAACSQPATVVNNKVLCDITDSTTINGPEDFASYIWSNGDTTQNITVKDPGVYTLQALNYGGCPIKFNFTVKSSQRPNVLVGDDTFCNSTDARVKANTPPGNYNSTGWDFGDGTVIPGDTQLHDFAISGSYTVNYVVTDSVCVYRYPRVLTILDNGKPTLPKDTICAGDTATFELTFTDPTVTVVWYDGDQSLTKSFSANGRYPFEVSDGSCILRDTAALRVLTPPLMSLGPDLQACEAPGVTLNPSGGPYVGYQWSTGETSPTITVTQSGTYGVVVDYRFCSLSDSMNLTVDTVPEFILPRDTNLCMFRPFQLHTGSTGPTVWQDGTTGDTYNVVQPGLYHATVTNNTCFFRDSIIVTETFPPAMDLGPDTTICFGFNTPLDATIPGATNYQWNTGESIPIINVTTGNTYSVLVTTPNCYVYDTITLRELPSPVPVVEDVYLCPDDTAKFDATSPNCTYEWSTGELTPVKLGRPVNIYTVVITNEFDCYITDTARALLRMTCPEFYVPNSFTPDGDGYNDYFKPEFFQVVVLEMKIYDRWGTVIYESHSPSAAWDGTHDGREVKVDVYNWVITYYTYDGNTQSKVGTVTLVR